MQEALKLEFKVLVPIDKLCSDWRVEVMLVEIT